MDMTEDELAQDEAREPLTLESAEAILSHDDVRYDYVPCPEWGGRIKVRSLTSKRRGQLERTLTEERRTRGGLTKEVNMQFFRETLMVFGCIKENGEPLFANEHIKKLPEKSAGPVQRCCDAIMRLSGIGKDDVEELTAELRESPSPAS